MKKSKINIPIYQPLLDPAVRSNVIDCIDSGWISSKGQYVKEFEANFSSFLNIKYSTSVSNGTTALHLALKALGISEKDEVIVPTFTYIASVNAISYVGASPVFVDSDLKSWNIDPELIEKKITKKTKAIMVVHIYGNPCDMKKIMQIAKKHNLYIIEDVAEGFGSKYMNKFLGSFGDISTFSFFGNKTITTGEGGMVSSNSKKLIDRVELLKNQAVSLSREYWHTDIGFNYRMTNIAAAIGVAQLKSADYILKKKRQIFKWYYANLNELPINFQLVCDESYSSYWMISILLNTNEDRDAIRQLLLNNGIETRPFFYPAHTMKMYSGIVKYSNDFPNATSLSIRGMSLPSFPKLSFEEVFQISKLINSYFIK